MQRLGKRIAGSPRLQPAQLIGQELGDAWHGWLNHHPLVESSGDTSGVALDSVGRCLLVWWEKIGPIRIVIRVVKFAICCAEYGVIWRPVVRFPDFRR